LIRDSFPNNDFFSDISSLYINDMGDNANLDTNSNLNAQATP
jgi:hypothetical protein